MADLMPTADDAVTQHYDLLRADSGLLHLDSLALVRLTGDDRKGWLQGQVTQELRRFEGGASTAFCVCEPTGHLLTVVDGWALPDRMLLTLPHETLPAFLRRVEQMVILEDVAAEDAGSEYRLISIQGPTATRKLSELVTLPNLDAGVSDLKGHEVFVLRSNRTGMGGWDLCVPKKARAAINALEKAFPSVSAEAYNIARLEAGIPFFGSDMNAKTLPPEMGSAFEARHISYNKGCYTGQEVLMRMHSRGHTNRTWVGLLADEPLEIGATISHALRPEAGVVTSAVSSPDYGEIGAAMVRNEVAYPGETVIVRTERGEVEAEVRPMPILRLD